VQKQPQPHQCVVGIMFHGQRNGFFIAFHLQV
jgi:hypothetical protein